MKARSASRSAMRTPFRNLPADGAVHAKRKRKAAKRATAPSRGATTGLDGTDVMAAEEIAALAQGAQANRPALQQIHPHHEGDDWYAVDDEIARRLEQGC